MIEKGYMEPPSTLIRVNGRKGIGIGVSTAPDYDVVKAGEAVRLKLATNAGRDRNGDAVPRGSDRPGGEQRLYPESDRVGGDRDFYHSYRHGSPGRYSDR